MQSDFTLSATERGYRQSGKRLLPRDAYDAAMCRHHGPKVTARSLRREAAIEQAVMGYKPDGEWAKVQKLQARLTRGAKRKVQELAADMHTRDTFGSQSLRMGIIRRQGRKHWARTILAMINAWEAAECRAADRYLLERAL